MRIYPIKKNPIGSAVSEILRYKQTDKQTSFYFVLQMCVHTFRASKCKIKPNWGRRIHAYRSKSNKTNKKIGNLNFRLCRVTQVQVPKGQELGLEKNYFLPTYFQLISRDKTIDDKIYWLKSLVITSLEPLNQNLINYLLTPFSFQIKTNERMSK